VSQNVLPNAIVATDTLVSCFHIDVGQHPKISVGHPLDITAAVYFTEWIPLQMPNHCPGTDRIYSHIRVIRDSNNNKRFMLILQDNL